MHTVKVIFQGGGARLPALIAAAEVLSEFSEFDENKNKRIQISHIYGVSAGSIAGCMLATKSSMASYREIARRAGENALRNLPKLSAGWLGFGGWEAKLSLEYPFYQRKSFASF
jgi:predicted acylesterase/phospholipase RssA